MTRDIKLSYSFTRGYTGPVLRPHVPAESGFHGRPSAAEFHHLSDLESCAFQPTVLHRAGLQANMTNFTQYLYEDPTDPRLHGYIFLVG